MRKILHNTFMRKHKDIYIFLIALVSVFVIGVALISSAKVLKILALKPSFNAPQEENLQPQEQKQGKEEYYEDPLITPAWKIKK